MPLASGYAQITIGLKGGGTIATVNETPTLANITNTDNISALTGGVFFEFGEGFAAFRPEVLLQQRGYEYTLADIDSTFLEQFNYLDIPITLRLRHQRTLGPNRRRKPWLRCDGHHWWRPGTQTRAGAPQHRWSL